MPPEPGAFQIARPRERAACALGGLTCTAGIFGALVLCFNAASPGTWLLPTPALTASLSRCEAQGTRSVQTECKKRVVAERQAPDLKPVQLARQ